MEQIYGSLDYVNVRIREGAAYATVLSVKAAPGQTVT
jgi:hypothetical protein